MNYSCPGGVWLVISRLETGNSWTFFYGEGNEIPQHTNWFLHVYETCLLCTCVQEGLGWGPGHIWGSGQAGEPPVQHISHLYPLFRDFQKEYINRKIQGPHRFLDEFWLIFQAHSTKVFPTIGYSSRCGQKNGAETKKLMKAYGGVSL